MLIVPTLAAPFARRLSLRAQLVASLTAIAAGSAWLTVVAPHVALATLAGPLVVMGIGIGLSLAVLDGAALSSVGVEHAGMASGMFNTVRVTADTASAAVAGSLLLSLTASGLVGKIADPTAAANAANTGRFTSSPVVGAAFSDALHVILWVVAGFALATIPVVLTTLRGATAYGPAEDVASAEAVSSTA